MGPIFLFGGTSFIGWNILQQSHGENMIPFCSPSARHQLCDAWQRVNMEDEKALARLFNRDHPRLVIHCAGICDVDKCEDHPDWAHRINVDGIKKLLTHLPTKSRLVYCSSDHVFSGNKGSYSEGSSPDPISVYGQTRVLAENLIRSFKKNHLILRFGLGIGHSIDGKSGHLDWLRYRHRRQLRMTVVEDEARHVYQADQLAQRILDMAHSNITGTRHITSSHLLSRLELAHLLNTKFHLKATIHHEKRSQRPYPHIGKMDLVTTYSDALAKPLSSFLDNGLKSNTRILNSPKPGGTQNH